MKRFNDFMSMKESQHNSEIVKLDKKEIDDTATAVENYDGVLDYICNDKKNKKRLITLTRLLKDELLQIFGKNNTTFKGEFFYYVWIVQFEDREFQIFTAKDKGTQFAIVGKLEEDNSKVCISFLKKMEELIDGVKTQV